MFTSKVSVLCCPYPRQHIYFVHIYFYQETGNLNISQIKGEVKSGTSTEYGISRVRDERETDKSHTHTHTISTLLG